MLKHPGLYLDLTSMLLLSVNIFIQGDVLLLFQANCMFQFSFFGEESVISIGIVGLKINE
jgi:hypothetical protein